MTLIYTSLYPKKCNWIAQALAESTQESLISNLKTYPYSLLFDETSTQKFKYAAFVVRIISDDMNKVENLTLTLPFNITNKISISLINSLGILFL